MDASNEVERWNILLDLADIFLLSNSPSLLDLFPEIPPPTNLSAGIQSGSAEAEDFSSFFLESNNQLDRIFFKWAKENPDQISAEDTMRSIKLRHSAINHATKHLGKMQLLNLILDRVGFKTQEAGYPNPNPNLTLNLNPPPNCPFSQEASRQGSGCRVNNQQVVLYGSRDDAKEARKERIEKRRLKKRRQSGKGGVTVVASEALSAYHVAPRTANENPPPAPVSAEAVKKKRGRPRKYGSDGSAAKALSPKPISSEDLGDRASCSIGANFIPHTITVNAGEDVTMKIISFSQQGPHAICILSAKGVISTVTLGQAGGTLTYEGRFEILSLTGSFMASETGGVRNRSGGMSVSLADPNGQVLVGGVAGLLVAASPVQIVVGSWQPPGAED